MASVMRSAAKNTTCTAANLAWVMLPSLKGSWDRPGAPVASTGLTCQSPDNLRSRGCVTLFAVQHTVGGACRPCDWVADALRSRVGLRTRLLNGHASARWPAVLDAYHRFLKTALTYIRSQWTSKRWGNSMKPRSINERAFGPAELKVINQAFDEAWHSVAGNFEEK